jgi:hypothetical protein
VLIYLSSLDQWIMSSGKENIATPSASHDLSKHMKIVVYLKEKLLEAIGNLCLALRNKNVCLIIYNVFLGPHSRYITDACNDAHAGYVIYNKLMLMAQSMTTIPKPVYYKFDAVRGRLCEPSGMFWPAFNPDYDPGPPPPKLSKDNPSVPPLVTSPGTSSALSFNQKTGARPSRNHRMWPSQVRSNMQNLSPPNQGAHLTTHREVFQS